MDPFNDMPPGHHPGMMQQQHAAPQSMLAQQQQHQVHMHQQQQAHMHQQHQAHVHQQQQQQQHAHAAAAPVATDVIVAACSWRGEQLGTIQIQWDWTHAQALEHLSHAINTRVYSIAFLDDDRDRIPVNDDTDYEEGFKHTYNFMQQAADTAGPIEVDLETDHQAGKKRNKLGLTVNVARAEQPKQAGFGAQFAAAGTQEQALQITEAEVTLGQMLGNGSGGTVFRSLYIPTQTIMAVKVIPLDANVQKQKQILAELEILHRCNSQFIIQYFGSFFNENRIMMCTEHMDAGSMEELGCIPEQHIGRVAVSVLHGLSYLESLKIMHRDIKPSNILMNTSGDIKLCDFGVSTQLAHSMTATYVGTNAYMAPERVRGTPYTIRSEIWSLGLSLVELALGRFPYPADSTTMARAITPIELLQCIVHEPPPRLPEAEFSPQFVDFTARCLVREAAQRPTPQETVSHPFVLYYQAQLPNKAEFAGWVHGILQQKAKRREEREVIHEHHAAKAASPPPGSHDMFHAAPRAVARTPNSHRQFGEGAGAAPSPLPGSIPMFWDH